MTNLRHRSLLAVAALSAVGCVAGSATAQTPTVRVAGRVHTHYRYSTGDSSTNYNVAAVNNGFEIRRLRIEADVRFGDHITLLIQPSFEMSALRMRDAYLRVGVHPRVSITLGQEKSPFNRYELTSANNILSIERGVRILGLSGREGLNDLLVNNGYAAHDLGAFVDYVAPDTRFTVKAGVQNGSRESATDVNNAKSFFGRATATVLTNADGQPKLQLGASFAARDRAICSVCPALPSTAAANTAYFADSSKMSTAFGLDLEWGGFRPGWHVIADFATGDNVPTALRVSQSGSRNAANLRNSADSSLVTFRAIQVVVAYRIATAGSDTRVVKMVEPALRIDVTDPNTDADDDAGLLVTPALHVYFANTVLLRAGLDLYRYKDAGGTTRTAREVKIAWQANF